MWLIVLIEMNDNFYFNLISDYYLFLIWLYLLMLMIWRVNLNIYFSNSSVNLNIFNYQLNCSRAVNFLPKYLFVFNINKKTTLQKC